MCCTMNHLDIYIYIDICFYRNDEPTNNLFNDFSSANIKNKRCFEIQKSRIPLHENTKDHILPILQKFFTLKLEVVCLLHR